MQPIAGSTSPSMPGQPEITMKITADHDEGYCPQQIDLLLGTVMQTLTEEQRQLPVFQDIQQHLAEVKTATFMKEQIERSGVYGYMNWLRAPRKRYFGVSSSC